MPAAVEMRQKLEKPLKFAEIAGFSVENLRVASGRL
jgi:hypothetical protein